MEFLLIFSMEFYKGIIKKDHEMVIFLWILCNYVHLLHDSQFHI